MNTIKITKPWLTALSLSLGLGLAFLLPTFASAQNSKITHPSNLPGGSISQGADSHPVGITPASPEVAERYYVSKSGDGTDGLSWTTAFTQVQEALALAASGDEIWVATGVYTPGAIISDSFNLAPGAALYGGFTGAPGTEGDFGGRDWDANLTILSGDIGGDDLADPNGVVTHTGNIVGDNSLHVVFADGASGTPITGTTALDGFTITAGQADGAVYPGIAGGGFFCAGDGSGSECSPTLENLVFSGNFAITYGGAIFNDGSYAGTSSPSLVGVTFSGNSAYRGGAVYNYSYFFGTSSPSLLDATFLGNEAGNYGGAIINDASSNGTSSPSLLDVTFSGNSADNNGGAMYNKCNIGTSSPSLVNVTFSANSAGSAGGAIYNDSFDGSCSLSLVNVILWGDTAASGKEMYNLNASPAITTSLVHEGITGTRIVNDNSSLTDGGGNIDGDPLFVRYPDPGDGSWATLADNDYGDLRLTDGSPAIDAGTNLPALPPADLDGSPRIINQIVDMGAYEFAHKVFLPLLMK